MAEPVLRPGSSGQAVRELQQALKGLGYDPGAVDGHFGPRTESAVKAFQKAQGLTVDGIVGDITWLNIDEADMSDPTIRRGSTGNPVRRAQKRLTLGGYDTGGVDGVRIPAQYRSFVYKTIALLRAAGEEVTVATISASIARWVAPDQAEDLRAVLEESNDST